MGSGLPSGAAWSEGPARPLPPPPCENLFSEFLLPFLSCVPTPQCTCVPLRTHTQNGTLFYLWFDQDSELRTRPYLDLGGCGLCISPASCPGTVTVGVLGVLFRAVGQVSPPRALGPDNCRGALSITPGLPPLDAGRVPPPPLPSWTSNNVPRHCRRPQGENCSRPCVMVDSRRGLMRPQLPLPRAACCQWVQLFFFLT